MARDSQPPNTDRDWQTLVAAARHAPPDALPRCDVDAIIAVIGATNAVERHPSNDREAGDADRRLVSWAALFAVAASLLLTFACWSEVSAMWSPPSIFDCAIDVGPLP